MAGASSSFGQPSEIYDEPADLFVADFVGKTNLLSGKVAGHSGDWSTWRLPTDRHCARKRAPFGRASRLGQPAP